MDDERDDGTTRPGETSVIPEAGEAQDADTGKAPEAGMDASESEGRRKRRRRRVAAGVAAAAAKHAELEAAMDALHSTVEVTPANCRHTAEMERVRQRYVELGYEPWLAAKMASRYGTDLQAEEDAAQGA